MDELLFQTEIEIILKFSIQIQCIYQEFIRQIKHGSVENYYADPKRLLSE